MVRTVITPNDTQIVVSISKEYIGKPIEITVVALDEIENPKSPKTMGNFFGILSDSEYESLKLHTESSRKEWDRDF